MWNGRGHSMARRTESRASCEPHRCWHWMQPLGLPQVSCGWAPHSAGVRALGMKGRTECESGFAWCLSFCPAQHLSWLEVKLRRVPGTTKWWLTTRALSNLLEPRSIGLPDRLTTEETRKCRETAQRKGPVRLIDGRDTSPRREGQADCRALRQHDRQRRLSPRHPE
jgi:hypothetical protein